MELILRYGLLVVSALLIAFGTKGLLPYFMARNWPTTSARIIRIKEEWRDVPLSPIIFVKYWYPLVEYEYMVDGMKYCSNRVSFKIQDIWVPEVDKWGKQTEESAKLWSSWQDHMKIPIYFNPRNPKAAVIVKAIGRGRIGHYLSSIVGGILCLVALVMLVV